MNRAVRLQSILDLLSASNEVSVEDIIATLDVSAATARRDLDSLASQQLLTRTHGGATGYSVAYDLPIRYSKDRFAAQKLRIAHAASALVSLGDVVGLCGGTTSTALATVLGSRPDLLAPSPYPNLTIVTNAINIAAQLAIRPQIKTVVTGGVVHPRSYELVGPFSESVLGSISLDLAFIGVNGVDPQTGASVSDEGEANINSLMASRATRAVIIADSSKIGKTVFATLSTRALTTLITDDGISDDARAAFADHGITVIVA